jgi:chaperonin GroES
MLPEKAIKKPNIGIVINTGDGTKNNEMVVKPGDTILFNRYAGLELMYKGEKHYVIMANEIIGILDDIDDISLEEFE